MSSSSPTSKYDLLAKELIEKGEWKEHKDKKTGRTYFSHVETKKVVWNLSAHLAKAELKKSSSIGNNNNNNNNNDEPNTPASTSALSATATQSRKSEAIDENHQNNKSNESSMIAEENLRRQQQELNSENQIQQKQQQQVDADDDNDHQMQKPNREQQHPTLKIVETENADNEDDNANENASPAVLTATMRTAPSAHASPQKPASATSSLTMSKNNTTLHRHDRQETNKSSQQPEPSFERYNYNNNTNNNNSIDDRFYQDNRTPPPPPSSPLATKMADKYLREYEKNQTKKEQQSPNSPVKRFKTNSFESIRWGMMQRAEQKFAVSSNASSAFLPQRNNYSSYSSKPATSSSPSRTPSSTTNKQKEQLSKYIDDMKELKRQLMNFNNNSNSRSPLPWQRFLASSSSLVAGLNEKMASAGVSANERRRYFLSSSNHYYYQNNEQQQNSSLPLTSDNLDTCFCLAVFFNNNNDRHSNQETIWAATCGFTKEEDSYSKWKPDDVVARIRGIAPLMSSPSSDNFTSSSENRDVEQNNDNDDSDRSRNEDKRDDLFYANDEEQQADKKPKEDDFTSTRMNKTTTTTSNINKPIVVLRASSQTTTANNTTTSTHICIDPSSHVTVIFDSQSQTCLCAFLILAGIGSSLPPIERLHRPDRGFRVSNLLDAFHTIQFLKEDTIHNLNKKRNNLDRRRTQKHEIADVKDEDENQQQIENDDVENENSSSIIETVCDSIVSLVSYADHVIIDQLEVNKDFHDRVQDNRVETSLLRAFEREQELKLKKEQEELEREEKEYELMMVSNNVNYSSHKTPFATQYIADDLRKKQLEEQKKRGDFSSRFVAPAGGDVRKFYDPNESRIIVGRHHQNQHASSSNKNLRMTSSSASWKDMHQHLFEHRNNNNNNNRHHVHFEDEEPQDRSCHPTNISSDLLLFSTIRESPRSRNDDEVDSNNDNDIDNDHDEHRLLPTTTTTRAQELRRSFNQSRNGRSLSPRKRKEMMTRELMRNSDDVDHISKKSANKPLVGTPSKTLDAIYNRVLLKNTKNTTTTRARSTKNQQQNRNFNKQHSKGTNNTNRNVAPLDNEQRPEDPDSSAAEITVGVLLGLERGRGGGANHFSSSSRPPQTVETPHEVLQAAFTPRSTHQDHNSNSSSSSYHQHHQHQFQHHQHQFQQLQRYYSNDDYTTRHNAAAMNASQEMIEENSRILRELVMSNIVSSSS